MHTDLNTLRSFEEEPEPARVAQLLNEVARLLQAEGYEAAFAYAMDVLREYPSCDMLAYGFAASLLGGLELAPPAQGRETFEAELDSLLERAAGAGDAGVRVPAQQLLINRCIQKKDTARAEALLGQLPQATFEPALIRASIHRAKGEDGQAARLLEGFLAQSAANLQGALMQLSEIALKEGDSQAACTIAHTAQEVFRLLGLWGPSLVTPMLQLNAQKRDVPGTLACLEEFLAALQRPWQANATPLYRHVPAKNADFGPNFAAMIARALRTDKDFAFLHGEPGFEAILQQFEQAAACSNCCRMASKPGSPCRKAKSLSVRSARAIMAAKLGPKSAFLAGTWRYSGVAFACQGRCSAARNSSRQASVPGTSLFCAFSCSMGVTRLGPQSPSKRNTSCAVCAMVQAAWLSPSFRAISLNCISAPCRLAALCAKNPSSRRAACPSSPLARWMEARMRAGSNVACGSWPSRASARAVSFF